MSNNDLGILERVLIRRYGQPDETYKEGMRAKIWASGTAFVSVLYYSTDWTRPPASEFRMHQQIYGACRGGTLVDSSLKVAMPAWETPFYLYGLHGLGEQVEVKRALELDPELSFFMDASNVWYFGHKQGKLFVYDAPFDELDELGPIESALEEIIAQWEEAKPSESSLQRTGAVIVDPDKPFA
ncbi:hypothetical protein [Polyangium jinanense]|uniref:Uncharacterized protein n=1 Tax=Polyangium jinanense TaxID=2829994 RepID=A0A9X3XFE7_9BACT|nr:hypothetical protein [Polyangium jinanense]MDC3960247.1 hypothetical protein [Polyangium jinanense]MDC3988033.1 hypothetical protein [Polyangium jinanense]